MLLVALCRWCQSQLRFSDYSRRNAVSVSLQGRRLGLSEILRHRKCRETKPDASVWNKGDTLAYIAATRPPLASFIYRRAAQLGSMRFTFAGAALGKVIRSIGHRPIALIVHMAESATDVYTD